MSTEQYECDHDTIVRWAKTAAVRDFSNTLSTWICDNLPKWGAPRHPITGEFLSFVNAISDPFFEPFFPLKATNDERWCATHYKNSVSCLLASAVAYETEKVIDAQMHAWGFDKVRFFSFTSEKGEYDTNGYIASNAETVLLCFRGTESFSIVDWITDLQMELVDINDGTVKKNDVAVPRKGTKQTGAMAANTLLLGGLGIKSLIKGRVHAGFRKAILSKDKHQKTIIENLLSTLEECVQDRKKKIFITGHSMGAALAIISGAMIALLKSVDFTNQIKGIYTFGQPRVGDAEFVLTMSHTYRGKIWRIVNHRDIVSRIPAVDFGKFAEGPGPVTYLDDKGELQSDLEKTPEDGILRTILVSSIPAGFKERLILKEEEKYQTSKIAKTLRFAFPEYVLDHFPGEYLDSLLQNVDHHVRSY